jgi:hypothetical protein
MNCASLLLLPLLLVTRVDMSRAALPGDNLEMDAVAGEIAAADDMVALLIPSSI